MLGDKLRSSATTSLTSHGSARFASAAERALLTARPGGLLIGRDLRSAKILRYDGPGHLLTIAPTRTGKGVGTVIPNLLMAGRSVICVDPKGENTAITAHARSRLGPVHVLDPFGITGQPSACFNPLAALDPASVDLAEDAATLAEALVFDAPGEAYEAHWNEEAKALIGGLILYLVCHESIPGRTLANLRGLLTMSPPDFANLLTMMQGSTEAGGLVARAANRHLGKADREATGVLSAAQRHTHFLDSPRMTAALDHSDFDFGDLKRRTATVFFVLPPDRLATYTRWLRLMVIQSLQDLLRAPGQPVAPVLYLLDEFAALGHLAPVERAMSLMAGYGVQLWPILQDLHQLRSSLRQECGDVLFQRLGPASVRCQRFRNRAACLRPPGPDHYCVFDRKPPGRYTVHERRHLYQRSPNRTPAAYHRRSPQSAAASRIAVYRRTAAGLGEQAALLCGSGVQSSY